MSDQLPNAPMMSAGPTSIFQTWINALTKPDERTYSEIAASPNAKATTAYLWVFITSIVVNLITFIVEGATIRDRLAQSGLGTDRVGSGIFGVLIALICIAPILAVIQTVIFAIVVAIVQWIAKMFSGKGTFDQMAYTFAAISVPYSLVSSVFILLSAIPYVGFCFRLILGIAGLYIFVLEIMAVKGVNQFGWGPAIGSLVIPILVVGLFCCCILVAIGAAMGSTLGNIFSTINQSLNP
jgi:Yip1 domain